MWQLRALDWPALARAWLALGCRGASAELLDDWVRCRDELLARGRLQPCIDSMAAAWARVAYEQRSALAFLLACCDRAGVAHELDLAAIDAKLATLGKFPSPPWGIPASHAWWTK